LSVPVRLRNDQYPKGHPLNKKTADRILKLQTADAYAHFRTVVSNTLTNFGESPTTKPFNSGIILNSAQAIGAELKEKSVDLIIASPPYLGAQKYIRASSLNLGWLGLAKSNGLRSLEDQVVGRDIFRKHRSRYALLLRFLTQMHSFEGQMQRIPCVGRLQIPI
jgi:hypothetical protein